MPFSFQFWLLPYFCRCHIRALSRLFSEPHRFTPFCRCSFCMRDCARPASWPRGVLVSVWAVQVRRGTEGSERSSGYSGGRAGGERCVCAFVNYVNLHPCSIADIEAFNWLCLIKRPMVIVKAVRLCSSLRESNSDYFGTPVHPPQPLE